MPDVNDWLDRLIRLSLIAAAEETEFPEERKLELLSKIKKMFFGTEQK